MNGSEIAPLLQTKGLKAYVDSNASLFGVDVTVGRNEAIALIGGTGSGASLTLRAIAGLVLPNGGEVLFKGSAIEGLPANEIAQMGIGFVPKLRRVFARLTVYENLEVGRRAGAERSGKAAAFERVFNLIPALAATKNRFAGDLDPVEQKMLIIGRCLMGSPDLMLLDEPVDGFERVEVDEIVKLLNDIRGEGVSMIIAEEQGMCHRRVCSRAYVLEEGKVENEIELAGAVCEGDSRDGSAPRKVLTEAVLSR